MTHTKIDKALEEHLNALQMEKEKLKAEILSLQEENEKLKDKIEDLVQEIRYVEREEQFTYGN